MNNIALLTVTSIKNNFRLKAVVITYIAVLLICIAGLVLSLILLLVDPALEAGTIGKAELVNYLGIILYSVCFISVGINMNVFAFQSMIREKTRGNIESLLATPLKVQDIWLAKSLAVFLPGMVLGWLFALVALVAVNLIYFVPVTGFLITPWMIINSFLAVPVIYFCLSLLVHLVGLSGKASEGNIIVQICLPVVVTVMINLTVRNVLDTSSWLFALVNFGIIFIVAVIVIIFKSRLTNERIVLSR